MVVHDEEFVVHATVQLPEVEQELAKGPQASVSNFARIEYPDVEIGMEANASDHPVSGGEKEIIYKQTHPHTPIGSLEQAVEQEPARHVILPDEILGIDGGHRMVDEGQSPFQRLIISFKKEKGRLFRPVGVSDPLRDLGECAGLCRYQCLDMGCWRRGRKGGTAGDCKGGSDKEKTAEKTGSHLNY
jgi:hypothetical protein